jgi:hypothetical protein
MTMQPPYILHHDHDARPSVSRLCTRAALPVAMRLNSVAFVPSRLTHNLQVSDDTVHFLKQKIFEHSTRSNSLKVVQNGRNAMLIFFFVCRD